MDALAERTRVTKVASAAVLEAMPPAATNEILAEINCGLIWHFVFVLAAMRSVPPMQIRQIVDDAMYTAIQAVSRKEGMN